MPDPLQAVLERIFDEEPGRWPGAVEEACVCHPELADGLRRRVGRLAAAGLFGRPVPESDAMARAARLAPGETLGGYEILDWLGSGGMGQVFRARHGQLGRVVALKTVRPELLAVQRAQQRFLREARAAATVSHPAVCLVHDFGEVDGIPYLAMELVEGESLASRIAQARRSRRLEDVVQVSDERTAFDELLRLFGSLASGLDAVHRAGLVHRDVKPENILLDAAGDATLIDFGLAWLEDSDVHTRLTQAGQPVGTPAYMAPEQVRGEAATPRTDVYAVGAVLYECVSLRAPFEAVGREALYRQILDEELIDPRRLVPRIPTGLAAILMRCLERSPDRRYASAAELADDLHRAHSGEPVHAQPVSALTRVLRRARRRPVLATAVLSALVIVGLLADRTERAVHAERNQAALAASRAASLGLRDTAAAFQQASAAWRSVPDLAETRSRLLLARARHRLVGGQRLPNMVGVFAPHPTERVALVGSVDGLRLLDLQAAGHLQELTPSLERQGVSWTAASWDPAGSSAVVAPDWHGGLLRVFRDGHPAEPLASRGSSVARPAFPGCGRTRPLYSPHAGIAHLPDGRFAAAGKDGTLWLFAAGATVPESILQFGEGPGLVLPDVEPGCFLFGGNDGVVRRIPGSARDVTQTVRLLKVGAPVTALARADGRCFVGTARGRVHVLEPDVRAVGLDWDPGRSGPVTELAPSPDGSRLAVAGVGQRFALLHGDLGSGGRDSGVLAALPGNIVFRAFAWSSDGRRLAVGDHGGRIRVVDAEGRPQVEWPAHRDSVTSLWFAADGTLWSAGWDGLLRHWHVDVPDLPVIRAHGAAAFRATWSPDGRWIASSGARGGLTVSDPQDLRRQVRIPPHGDLRWTVAWSEDGQQIASWGPSGLERYRVLDHPEGPVLESLPSWPAGDLPLFNREVRGLPGGGWIGAGGVVELWSPTGERVELADPDLEFVSVDVDATGREALLCGLSRQVVLQHLDGSASRVVLDCEVVPWHVRFLPRDSSRFLIGFADGRVELRRTTDGSLERSYTGVRGKAKTVDVSPDGRFVATASTEGSLYVWTIEGDLWLELPQGSLAHSATFSPDGRHIAVACADGSVRVWPVTEAAIREAVDGR